ncbi:hypothetical protein NBRGN_083_00400 [Nocardia brasiliensis NBRC 14402]|uniref:hypothetical protein n=1 Tax=Nocardia brasiliensis TaxID=37326 RepID=UPI0002F49F83|nr:hypothetical protein [Nocardia brasiliensis]ASF12334.1 hypothetical protein CEQ30_38900 [Nocardia brasiliensis]GAJ85128.1 hypothetical protein NBRGN_083_00400 [Nocardia brasiliensis NBRC 14402]SUB53284.1 Uncharacterised protein [Nocardia brasiliensis]
MTRPLAHGLNGAGDLPIPLTYALIGAAWALTFSFAILLVAWRRPRLDPDGPDLLLPAPVRTVLDARPVRIAIAVPSVLAAVLIALVAVFGSSSPQHNPVPGVLYIYVWVGVMLASLVFGPVWQIVSPVRAVHRFGCAVLGRDPGRGVRAYPEAWGYRPAVLGLFAFVWLELASPAPGSVAAVGWWLLGYVVLTLAGLVLFGTTWAERGDPFEVYSSLLARLSPLGRRSATGAPVLRWPLHNLAGTPVRPGAVALAATLLGSTAFDSLSALPGWRELVDTLGGASVFAATLVRTGGLLTVIAVVGLLFAGAARATGGLSRAERARLPGLLVHSITPIVAGYIVAHYLTFLVEKGQATALLFADPFQRGWDIAGLGHHRVVYLLSAHPAVLAGVKVLAVLAGHVLGVTAAHDRCLRVLPPAQRATGQLALMLTMVGFTFTGLYLLFGG